VIESGVTAPARTRKHRQAAVVGIHALPFSKNIGMTERHSGALAILGALEDAGLRVADVDAMFRYYWENTTEMEMARILGCRTFACSARSTTAAARAPRPCSSPRSRSRTTSPTSSWSGARAIDRRAAGPWASQYMAAGQDQFERPYHVARPVDGMAFHFRYWMHKYGWTPK
jgi:hypothetical protein